MGVRAYTEVGGVWDATHGYSGELDHPYHLPVCTVFGQATLVGPRLGPRLGESRGIVPSPDAHPTGVACSRPPGDN